MTTTLLEKTIISNARQLQSALAAYYPRQRAGATSEDDEAEYLSNYHQLTALLILAHQVNNGMTLEAVQQLLAIEHEDAAALQGTALTEKAPITTETLSAGDSREWFNQGFDAYQRGDSFDERPDYASNPRRSTFWAQGWSAGQNEAKGDDAPA